MILQEQFVLPLDVDGWLAAEEGIALSELARGKVVLEIGSYCGRSTICMAQTAKQVISIDTHDGRGTPRPRNTWGELHDNLMRYGITNVIALRGTVATTRQFFGDALFDFIFIDGAHDKASVQADLDASLKVLAPDGLIAFHDYEYRNNWEPGVSFVVNNQLAAGAKLVSRHMSIAVIKPVREMPDSPNLTVHRPGVTTA